MSYNQNHPRNPSADNLTELLQLILEQPVYVADGITTIACLVAARYFTEIGGVLERFGVERWSATQLAQHGIGRDDPDACYQPGFPI